MSFKEKLFEFLFLIKKGDENARPLYGTSHLLWIIATGIVALIIIINYKKYNEKSLKRILFLYAIPSLILELLTQLSRSVHTAIFFNFSYFDYFWNNFPFQLCSTPMYVALICLFLKKGKLRNYLLSYIAFITIWGSMGTMLFPGHLSGSPVLFTHSMYLHCGSLILSIYLFVSKEVSLKFENVLNSYVVFLLVVLIAQIINISVFQSGLLTKGIFDRSINLLYISPYFVPEFLAFKFCYNHLPYYAYVPAYLLTLFMGGCLVYYVVNKINDLIKVKIIKKA
jgi:hypothetical protein